MSENSENISNTNSVPNKTLEQAKKILTVSWPYMVIAFAIYLLTVVQMADHKTILDIDTIFHYNRFYDISQQIKTGNYSYFQTNFGFNQSGRIINALYGPAIAYLNGALLLVAGSWFRFQIISYWVIGLIGGVGMYQLGRKAGANKVASTMVAVLFLNIGAVQAWIDHTNFIAWGAILVPYAFIEGINMVQDHDKPIRWMRLMLIMSLIAQTHVISTLLTALGLIPFAVYGFSKANNKQKMLLNLLYAVVGTILLSANVWGALLLIFGSNHIAPTLAHSLTGNAVTLANGTIRDGISKLLVMLFILQVGYALMSNVTFKKQLLNKLNILVSVEGFLILLLSSDIFPWKFVQKTFPFLRSYLQFPHRFLILAYPLLLVGLALTITQLSKVKPVEISYVVLVFTAFVTMQNYGANYNRIAEHTNNLSRIFVVKKGKEKEYAENKGVPKAQHLVKYSHGLTGDQKIYGADSSDSSKYGKLYIRSAARGVYYHNTTNDYALKLATRTREGKYKLFELVEKINPDYLPVKNKKVTAEVADRSYIKHVVIPQESGKYKYSVQGSKLILTWNAKKKGHRTLPVVMYKQSRLYVNGKHAKKPTKHSKSKVKTPKVKQKKGKNVAVLIFKAPTLFTWMLFLTLGLWVLLICYGLYQLIMKYAMKDNVVEE